MKTRLRALLALIHGCISALVWMFLLRYRHTLLAGLAAMIVLSIMRVLLSILLIDNISARKLTIFFGLLCTICGCALVALGVDNANPANSSEHLSSAVSLIWIDVLMDIKLSFIVLRTLFVGNAFLRDASLDSGSVANILKRVGKSQSSDSGIFCCQCLQELSLGDEAVVLFCNHIMHHHCAENRASLKVAKRRMMCPMRCERVTRVHERRDAQSV
eukprot:TRINITY_DN9728_c0_g1_i1.p1 TRINITY_DN9728_c0_g1~~TRINITY_DN9728_c0_g1_i1.p1  ORF type:complete len:216 (-),score=27.42 TRINITY_DN9728_c0_g1_i1:90-737(-)